jgi:MFS family permease
MVLSRLGGNMWMLALILFVLQRYHSPAVAGLATFLTWVPGLVLGPLAGALLDRHGRARLIALDHGVAVAGVVALVLLDLFGRLTPTSLLAVVGVSSLTLPLTTSGTRSLMPLLAPRRLWERVNALDSATFNATVLLGPVLAGGLIAAVGGIATLAVIGTIWLPAGLLVLCVREPATRSGGDGHVLREAWDGLRYAARNPVLRGLSVLMPLVNAGAGVVIVALPVLVLSLPGGGDAVVGALRSASGLAALAGSILAGRIRSAGRERAVMAATLLLMGVATLVIAAAARLPGPLVVAGAALTLAGAVEGPFDVAMFSLRQRATDPAWFGRAMSISMSVNALGVPIGSVLAGVAVGVSLTGTLVAAGVLTIACAVLCPLLVPARAE